MSKVDKLSLLGVRSFDNSRSETIQFYTPLTLIVGYNGSGKTTIIESLKYATTGELPPGSKTTGAFIHDPKLCGEKEVLAQVKLSFKSKEGHKMVSTRNLQLTVKKTTRTMKTLEGNILMVRDGERMVMSSRVAEVNDMMPKYLGVSKAILDSVIFCHQDESLWPLSEPSFLKKRFDAIFEAEKYTKAIDNIKIMQKNQKIELGQLKITEQNAKVNKDRGEKMRKQSERLYEEVEQLRSQCDDLGAKIKEAASRAESYWSQAQDASTIVGELTGKRIELRTKEESVQSLRRNLKEMSESDAVLQRMLEQYEQRVHEYENEAEQRKHRYVEITDEIKGARDRVSNKERECGSYEAQQTSYERQLANREKLVKEVARTHNIRGFDYDINDQQVEAFMDRITKIAREQNALFERTRRETQEQLQEAQKVLNQLNEKKSVLNQQKNTARSTVTQNDQKIAALQTQMDQISIDEGGKAGMKSKAQETESRIQNARANQKSADSDNKLNLDGAEKQKIEARRNELANQLFEATRQAKESAQIDFLRKEVKEKQRSLDTMKNAHGEKIGSIVGNNWAPATLEADFQREIDDSASQVRDAEKQRDGTNSELASMDYKLKSLRTDLRQKQQELKKAEEAIKEVAEPAEYLSTLKWFEERREAAKEELDQLPLLIQYLDSCVQMAREKGKCRTCARHFTSNKDDELAMMTKAVANEKARLTGDNSEKLKEELEEYEAGLENARKARSHYDDWERLSEKEVPKLVREEKLLSGKREELVTHLEKQDTAVDEKASAKRDKESVSKTVQNIAKYHTDITGNQRHIKELETKNNASGASRAVDEIQEDTNKANEELRAVDARIKKTTDERDRLKNELTQSEYQLVRLRGDLDRAEYQLKERRSIESQIEDHKNHTTKQRTELKSFDEQIQKLVPQLSEAQAKYDDTANRGADKDRELQTSANKLNTSLNQLKVASQDITAYIEKGGPSQLERGRTEVANLKGEVTQFEEDLAQIAQQIKKLDDQLRNHEETKRSISDNQRYRQDLSQVTTVAAEVSELESHNAEADKEYYEREGSKHQMERNKLASEQATIIGSLKSKDVQLAENLENWDVEYKDSARAYKEAHIKVETTKACVEDLGRYGGALDKAIMKYHSLKMEEINRIIEDLWRKTYQGTDVDTILIRSESEAVKTNKSYNYRVCMVKQDAEMDMRGRCSAGQKVLASIIIRLALAECFGVNCGLIALDEPTTNLDRDNIRALASSLAEIIRYRRAQKNFQLIVITHDEEFLRDMGCSDFADAYWRVSRNAKQKSIIEKQNIAEVI